MPPDHRDPTDPREWLRRARGNLIRARADRDLAGVVYEDLCFDAQQAAEKAIKAVLLGRGVAPPRTHDLLNLLDLAASGGIAVPVEIREADALTAYAVAARYPGLTEDVTKEEYLQAISFGERVLQWAESLLPGTSTETPQD